MAAVVAEPEAIRLEVAVSPVPVEGARRRRWAPWEVATLTALATVLIIAGIQHAPWFDEAQAWLIARDDGIVDLLTQRMRHEGTPPLWHLLLLAPAKLGLPYRTMSVLSGVACMVTGWLLVRRSPFPPLMRAALPFTYFLLFQYGVVARSYCLLAAPLLIAAEAFPQRRERPFRVVLPMLVAALTCVQGFIIVGTLEAMRWWELRGAWHGLDARVRRAQIASALLSAIALLAVVVEVWPDSDVTGSGSWHVGGRALGALTTPSLLNLFSWIAMAAVVTSIVWLRARGVASLLVVPGAALLAFFVTRYFSPWHAGALWILWVAALWVGWRLPLVRPVRGGRDRAGLLLPPLLAAAVAGQLVWTASSIVLEARTPYSGGSALASYIRDRVPGQRVYASGKWIAAAFPYLQGMPVANYNGGSLPAFYPFSARHNVQPDDTWDLWVRDLSPIVVSVKAQTDADVWCLPGYRVDAVFPGSVVVAGAPYESETFVVFVRDPASTDRFGATCVHVAP